LSKRRVAITGLGIISPIGNNVPDAWNNVVAGKSGITRITRFDASAFASQIAGEVQDFDATHYLAAKDARRMDIFIHYGMAAAIQAVKDAGIEDIANTQVDAERVGVNIGSGIGGLSMIEDTHNAYLAAGPRKISPFFIPSTIINMIAGNLSIMFGFKGPNLAIVTACTTATHCIGDSARLIEYGDVDVMVAGGAESCVTPLSIGGFASARALSTRNDDPATASRPWDKGRDGFVLGEGAGILVLEEMEHAKRRGAKIYAELAGFGMSADAYHMTAPCEDGEGAARCMANAL
jgi:3-oxoacyl-[acyl-carrier-protein] synthase II